MADQIQPSRLEVASPCGDRLLALPGFDCPVCGWEFPEPLPACPRCAADERRSTVPYVDICQITDADGVTRRLPFQIRVF